MKKKNITDFEEFYVGYDIGIGSVGWSIIAKELVNDENKYTLIDNGVYLFDQAIDAKEARTKRSARRNTRRRKWRIKQLRDAFVDFGIIDEKEIDQEGYKEFNNKNYDIDFKKFPTIYHLRKYALNNKVSLRELYLCLLNITKTRGHFLLEGKVDFSDGKSVDIDVIYEQIINIFETHLDIKFSNEEEKVLREQIENLVNNNKVDVKSFKKHENYDEINYILNILKGKCKTQAKKFFARNYEEIIDIDNEEEIKKYYELSNFIGNDANEPHQEIKSMIDDLVAIKNNIANYRELNDKIITKGQTVEYICELDVLKHELVRELNDFIAKKLKTTDEVILGDVLIEYLGGEDKVDDFISVLKNLGANVKKETKITKEEQQLRIDPIKNNVSHNYPNGMYLNEAINILDKQSEYYDELNLKNEDNKSFKDVISSIIKSRIPYYMGPISEDRDESKNSWLVINEEFKNKPIKYSYDYMRDLGYFDEEQSIVNWKESMISHCTYLPDKLALPKESFVMQLFSILNEINNFKVKSRKEGVNNVTKEEKIKIIENIFLNKNNKGKTIKCSQVCELLNLEDGDFGSKSGRYDEFNNKFTLYFDIIDVIKKLEIKDIKSELIDYINDKNNTSNISIIEDIILNLNLLDDTLNKENYFRKINCLYSLDLDDNQINRLSRLNTTKFSSLSKEIIVEKNIQFEYDGEECSKTMIEWLLDTDLEQMSILTKGQISVDKYTDMIKNNDNKLDINLFVQKGKARLPISRAVIRSLNICMKIHNEIIRRYGVPSKVVLETARDLKDFSEQGEKSVNRFKNNEKLLNDVVSKKRSSIIMEEENKLSEIIEDNKMNRDLQRKIELYIRQAGYDLVSLKKMDINDIVQNPDKYHYGHIIPRKCGDNSKDNIVLITEDSNKKQTNRVPLEYLREENPELEQKAKDIYTALYKNKLISKEKFERLMLEDTNTAIGFVGKNINDTRYIIKEFKSCLEAFNKVNEYNTKVKSIKGQLNGMYRHFFKLYKTRICGHQHHAHDATLVIIMDLMESRRRKLKGSDFKGKDSDIFYRIYKQVFNEEWDEENSLINQMKDLVPLYNCKVERKYTGKLFQATMTKKTNIESVFNSDKEEFNKIYKKVVGEKSTGSEEDIAMLKQFITEDEFRTMYYNGITGISVNKSFTGFSPYCIDLYNLDNELVQVIVPKILIKNGKIDKEAYYNLINCKNDKLIKNNEVDFDKFLFRINMKELLYNDNVNELIKVKGGSIKNEKSEIERIDIYSYNEYLRTRDDVIRYLNDQYLSNIKVTKKNYKKNIEEVVTDPIERLLMINNDYNYLVEKNNVISSLKDDLGKIFIVKTGKNKGKTIKCLIDELNRQIKKDKVDIIKDFVNVIVAYVLIDGKYENVKNPPSNYQIQKVLGVEKNGENSGFYIKVKPNLLGIRGFKKDGTLVITGPRYCKTKEKASKKIKKEKFSYIVDKKN